MVDWNRVARAARHYAASLVSALYQPFYGVYRGLKGAFNVYNRRFNDASYDFLAGLGSMVLQPFYSIYRAAVGTAELFGYPIPWYSV